MKRGLVTGAASGLGAASADRLRADGIEVITLDVAGPVDLHVDVTDDIAVARAAADAGPIEILVNSAGIVGPNVPLLETTSEAWRRTLDVNVVGVVNTIRAFAPGNGANRMGADRQLREHGGQGRQPEPGRVLRVKGGGHRPDEIRRKGTGHDWSPRQRHRPRRDLPRR